MAHTSDRIPARPSFFLPAMLAFALPALAAAQAVIGAAHDDVPRPTSYRDEDHDRTRKDELDFAVGNIEYLVVHELAHLLISEKDVPIVGPVENAADYVATIALIREQPLDPAQRGRAQKFLLAAASAFAASWKVGTGTGAAIPYWDEHALTIQRYYQIACLLYGSDPAGFATMPRAAGLPPARAEDCVGEYQRANRAIDWLLQTFGRQPGDPLGAATEISYERPPTIASTAVVRRLKSTQLLERLIARLHERFTLERPFLLVLRSCGQPEAAWMPGRRELAICYELVDALYVLGRHAEPIRLDDATRLGGRR